LKISAPRGLGLTTAAVQILMKYPASMLIAPNDRMEKDVIRAFGLQKLQLQVQSINKVQIVGKLGFSLIDVLIIDPWSAFQRDGQLKRHLEEFKTRVMEDVKLFVLLG
jgi:hypothetical protein